MKIIKSNSAQFIPLVLLLFLFFGGAMYAQTPYTWKPRVDYPLLGVGILSAGASQYMIQNTDVLTLQEINSLAPSQVNKLDRGAISNSSAFADNAREILLGLSIAAPLTLLLDKNVRKDWFIMGAMGAEVLLLTYGITSMTKPIALRARPYTYNSSVPIERKQDVDARFSMFSRTTAVSASVTFFAAKVYADMHPNSKWKPVVWTAAAIVPGAVAWASVESGNHFPTDVIIGYSVGAAIGVIIPAIHLKKNTGTSGLNIQPSLNGLAFNWVF